MSKRRKTARRHTPRGQAGPRSVVAETRPRVSACMIVKNEEHNLPRCLESLRSAVDEIIVVDTGSSDRTVAVAQQYGAKVSHFRWCDDFAAARNESLRLAKGEWITWIDADEELVEREPGALRALCDRLPAEAWGYLVDQRSPTNEAGDSIINVKQWRVCRNRAGVRFEGRIHETLAAPKHVMAPELLPQEDVYIHHLGYIPNGNLLRQKGERNRLLLERAIEEHPTDPYYRYCLGQRLGSEGDYRRALQHLEQAIELWFTHGQVEYDYLPAMFGAAAAAATGLTLWERALEIEARTPAHYGSADLLYHAGLACWQLRRYDGAIQRLSRAYQDESLRNVARSDSSTWGWRPLLALARLHDAIDQPQQAYEFAARAAELARSRPEVLFSAGFLSHKIGRPPEESVHWLRLLLKTEADDGFKPHGRRLLMGIAKATGDAQLELEAASGEVASPLPSAIGIRIVPAGQAQDKGSDKSTREPEAAKSLNIGMFFRGYGGLDFNDAMLESRPLGGSESAFLRLARALRAAGHDVRLEQDPARLQSLRGVDALIVKRHPLALERPLASQTFLWSSDDVDQVYWEMVRDHPGFRNRFLESVSGLVALSEYHARRMVDIGIPREKIHVIRYGIDPQLFDNLEDLSEPARPPRCVYSSTPFRGLDVLLDVWPEIKAQVPSAELQIFSSMAVYGPSSTHGDHEFEDLYQRARTLPGVHYSASVSQPVLAAALKTSRLLLYPNTFPETCCLAAMEAQAAGCAVVTSSLGALPETASGNVLIAGDPATNAYRTEFVGQAVELLRDDDRWLELSRLNRQRIRQYTWEAVAQRWERLLRS